MKIVITSTNPVKINAVVEGFKAMFPNEQFDVHDIKVETGVSSQPMTEDETLTGAKKRVENAMKEITDADYYVGIEGGIELEGPDMKAFAWVYIESKDKKSSKGRTGTFYLPKKTSELIQQGYELGVADEMVFKEKNSKQRMGSIGLLTNNALDRTGFYIQAVIFALIPFLKPELY